MHKLDQIHPVYGKNEIDAVLKYLNSGGWLTEFRETAAFERDLEDFLGVKHCRTAPNGTLALYLAFLGLSRLNSGKAVVPAFTMYASAIAPTMVDREVVFVDIDPKTLGIDVGQLEDLLERDPEISEVVIVHINGRPAMSYDKIKELMEKYPRVGFIEDACQALGSKFENGQFLGTAGDFGCFSFSPHKIITTGQGGAIVTNEDHLFTWASVYRDFGRVGGRHNHVHWGTNLRFTDLQAVFGRAQLQGIENRLASKTLIYCQYWFGLARVLEKHPKAFDMILLPHNATPWYVDIFVDDVVGFRKYLDLAGIGTQVFYPPVPSLGPFRAWNQTRDFPVTEQVSARGVWLPSSIDLSLDDIDYVCDAIERWVVLTMEDR